MVQSDPEKSCIDAFDAHHGPQQAGHRQACMQAARAITDATPILGALNMAGNGPPALRHSRAHHLLLDVPAGSFRAGRGASRIWWGFLAQKRLDLGERAALGFRQLQVAIYAAAEGHSGIAHKGKGAQPAVKGEEHQVRQSPCMSSSDEDDQSAVMAHAVF